MQTPAKTSPQINAFDFLMNFVIFRNRIENFVDWLTFAQNIELRREDEISFGDFIFISNATKSQN